MVQGLAIGADRMHVRTHALVPLAVSPNRDGSQTENVQLLKKSRAHSRIESSIPQILNHPTKLVGTSNVPQLGKERSFGAKKNRGHDSPPTRAMP